MQSEGANCLETIPLSCSRMETRQPVSLLLSASRGLKQLVVVYFSADAALASAGIANLAAPTSLLFLAARRPSRRRDRSKQSLLTPARFSCHSQQIPRGLLAPMKRHAAKSFSILISLPQWIVSLPSRGTSEHQHNSNSCAACRDPYDFFCLHGNTFTLAKCHGSASLFHSHSSAGMRDQMQCTAVSQPRFGSAWRSSGEHIWTVICVGGKI